jgi:hypothetical protein
VIQVALTEDDAEPGTAIFHQPHCPVVDKHRREGRMICTMMFDKPLDEALKGEKRHSCLEAPR